jgi:quinol monooxygenase YgiN
MFFLTATHELPMVLNSTMDGCSLQGTAAIFQSTTDCARIGGREFGRKPMAMLRVFGMTVAAGLMAGIASANAQDTSATYVVSYIEVAPSSAHNAAAVLRALRDASRKEAGNSSFEILQRIGQSQQFAILEVWRDTRAQAGHAAATDTAQLRDKLKPYRAAPIDERLHTGFVVGQSKASGAGSVYVLTHVDLIGAKKDEGLAAIKQLSIDSTQDAGILRYDVLQQGSRPNHLTLVEMWRGKTDLEKHEIAAHTRKFRELLLPMSGSLYDQRLYRAIN